VGFGCVIAAVFAIMAIIVVMCTVMGVTFINIKELYNALNKQLELSNERIKTRMQINNIIIDSLDPSTVYVNITNIGSTSIKVEGFNKTDVIVIYTSTTGTKITARLMYNASGVGVNIWYVRRVFVNGREDEVINPMNFENNQGLWDPGETIEIVLKLEYNVDSSKGFALVITLPNGARTSHTT